MILLNLLLLCIFSFIYCDSISGDILQNVHEKQERMWHSYRFDTGIGNREELIIKRISSDDTFDIGENVTEWQSINLPDKIYSVGLMPNGFTILFSSLDKDKSGFEMDNKILVSEDRPTAFTLYKFWNFEQRKYDIILIAATSAHLLHWYKIADDSGLQTISIKKLESKVTHLKIFQAGDFTKLLVLNSNTANIYNLDLNNNILNLRLFQTIELDCTSNSSAINNFGLNIFLSIPQQCKNSVLIYHYINDKFALYNNITSENVAFATNFQIGHKSFLAVGGVDFSIYRFTSTGLVEEEITDINFEEVTYFLPVSVNTYRDEVFLIIQHHIDYSSHVAAHVKILIYSKGAFVEHDEIPCSFFGMESYGATCLADAERDSGIYGASVLSQENILGVIVPRLEVQSGLFFFDWKLEEVVNPIVRKAEEIIQTRKRIEKILEDQRKQINEIRRKLAFSLKPNQHNEITAPWRINTVITSKTNIDNYESSETQQQYDYMQKYAPLVADFQLLSDEIESIKLKVISSRSAINLPDNMFENLRINGTLEVQGSTFVDNLSVNKFNDENFDDLVKDCVKQNEKTAIKGIKTIQSADIENLVVAKINDKDIKNMAIRTRNEIKIKGNLKFDNSLRVLENVNVFEKGKINKLNLKQDIIYMNSNQTYSGLKFENIDTKNLTTKFINNDEVKDSFAYDFVNNDGLYIELDDADLSMFNITTKNINNKDSLTFAKNLCLINLECNFKNTITIHGKLKVHGTADVSQTLNNVKYPEDFLRNKKTGFTKIIGNKKFTGNVSCNALVVDETVDEIIPEKIITLSTNQTIPGNFTFANLEITESLNVDGLILVGPNLTKFIPNPTLEDSTNLNISMMFNKLEVDGTVTISNVFKGHTVEKIFGDVIYKDDTSATINCIKDFKGNLIVKNNLDVQSNLINDIKIDNLITTDTEQTIILPTIKGKVTIGNLDIDGLYNNNDLKKQFDEIVWLDKDEDIKSEIIFENSGNDPDIFASTLFVESINDFTKSDLYWVNGDRVFEEVEFDEISADKADILKHLNYEIECFDIKKYDETRLSKTKVQNVTGNIKVKNGEIEQMTANKVNNYDWFIVKKFIDVSELFMERLLSGQFKITNLHINNTLHAKYLNNQKLDKLFKNVFWINKPNKISKDITFEDEIIVSNLKLNKLNHIKFKDFVEDIVLKNTTNVKVKGTKLFSQGFEVNQDINTDKLNNINVINILLGSDNQEIFSPVFVHGNVWIHEDLNVKDAVNKVPVKYIKDHFEVIDNNIILKGNISFKNDVTIKNLTVKGLINKIDPNKYFKNIVGIFDHVIINGTTVFKDKVHIIKNFGVATTIDGVNLDKFIDEVVFTSSDDHLKGLVTFVEDVIIVDTIEIETDLDTEYLFGCKVQDWLNKAVIISNKYLPGQLTFENVTVLTNLKVDFINDLDMNTIIPLHTRQYINQTLNFNSVSTDHDVKVEGLVNGLNFEKEFNNTVLISEDQQITTKIIFSGRITIKNDLRTTGLINNKNLERLVTTNSDQNLTASYIFNGKVSIDSNLNVTGKVNDIDIRDWYARFVPAISDTEEDIHDVWGVDGGITFGNNVTGSGKIGQMDVKDLAKQVWDKQEERLKVEGVIKHDYRNVCASVEDLVNLGKSQIFLFKYLEIYQEFNYEHNIGTIHYFQHKNRNFLLLSQTHSCYSFLYEWNSFSYEQVAKLKTGDVEQFITVKYSNRLYLITKHDDLTQCEENEVNLWIFKDDSVIHILKLNHTLQLHESKLFGTFYSLQPNYVTEYKLRHSNDDVEVFAYRNWTGFREANYTFNSHKHKMGLSLRNGDKILKLSRKGPKYSEDVHKSTINIRTFDIVPHRYLPQSQFGEFVVFEVGVPGELLRLTAVTSWEDVTVGENVDEIKIYEDFDRGKLFHKISVSKPSNLNVLDFGHTGETLLVFLENYQTLKVYEYKGIIGFKERSSVKIKATKLISLSLPLASYQSERKFLLLVYENKLTVVQAVMDGDRLVDNFYCDL